MNYVDVKNVSKRFQSKLAVNGVSFSVGSGKIVAILGPNGAGKTTTISMILGILHATEGSIKVFGKDPIERSVREKLGVMLQELSVLDGLTVGEVIDLFRSYYPNPLDKEELLTLSGLKNDVKKRTEKLSGGQKRRLSFALAIAGDPELLFFDEPTVGMDTKSRREFWQTVRSFADKGKSIIFSTHYLQEADDMADRIILLSEGTIVSDGTPDEVKALLTTQAVSFIAEDYTIVYALEGLPDTSKVYENKGRTYVETKNTDAVLEFVFKRGYKVTNIQIDQGKLDEAFEKLTEVKEEAN